MNGLYTGLCPVAGFNISNGGTIWFHCQSEVKHNENFLSLQIEVDPEYHPKIIGRKGAVISKIRSDHGVQINFLKKGDPEEHIITITGYEQSTLAARDDIMKIVNDLVNCTLVSSCVQSKLKCNCDL